MFFPWAAHFQDKCPGRVAAGDGQPRRPKPASAHLACLLTLNHDFFGGWARAGEGEEPSKRRERAEGEDGGERGMEKRSVSCESARSTRVVFLGDVADKIGAREDREYPVPTFVHV